MDRHTDLAGLKDFQRNVGFVVVVIVGGLAIFVYLASKLANLSVPLIWAAFFAVPLTALIALIDHYLSSLLIAIRGKLQGEDHEEQQRGWEFTAQAGRNQITLTNTAAKSLLNRLEHPGCIQGPWSRMFQSRIRLISLTTEQGEKISEEEVDRLVLDWVYYIKDPGERVLDGSRSVPFELYLDQECIEYPAVVSNKADGVKLKGTLELDRTSVVSWCLAMCIALMLQGIALFVFFLALTFGFDALQANTDNYAKGVEQFIHGFIEDLHGFMTKEQLAKVQWHIENLAKSWLPGLASHIAGFLGGLGSNILLFVLYLTFWVFEPIPVSSNVAKVIKDYLLLKTVSCMIYAVLMAALLCALGCPIWHLVFVTAFLLNYIPDFGPLVMLALVIPAVGFNSEHTVQERQRQTMEVVAGTLIINVLVGNILEAKMFGARGGQYMRAHPVVITGLTMFFLAFFGITGTFLTIPVVAIAKYYVLSADIPSIYLNPTLAILEGSEHAPHKNFVDRHSAGYGSTEPTEASKV